MSLTISYKGVDIVDETADCNKTLKTAGKYCEADIEVGYTSEAPTLITKSITANGTYNAQSEGADGYSSVSVEVKPMSVDYIHFSFDDITHCLGNLISENYTSVWDEPFFAWLKTLHNQYNAKFSLYIYDISTLENVPNAYADELKEAADWLKFGLHAPTSSTNYANASYNKGYADWNYVVSNLMRICGTHKAIDRIPRLGNFAGSYEALTGMRDANCGAMGFLSADDTRTPYYFNSEQTDYLQTHDILIDSTAGLLFYHTDQRSEDVADVYADLASKYGNIAYSDTMRTIVCFTHEQQVYTGSTLKNQAYVTDVCEFARDYGLDFDFPMNRIGYSLASLHLEGGEKDPTLIYRRVYNSATPLEAHKVASISDMTFVVNGESGNNAEWRTGVAGRASTTQILETNGGETITLTQGISGATINLALVECVANANNIAEYSGAGENFGRWITDNVTLQNNTKLLAITFKRTSGSFTDAEVALLPSCLTIS